MATFKCKMCGGTLNIQDGSTVAECEYCGTKQTLPKLDDEKRANLYDRANHFRRSNEFDKASAIYEQILTEDTTDAEAYWSLVLCRYGIEYVEDPLSHRRVPTVHRAQFTSVFDDDNYKSAIKNADAYQRVIYEEEARAINEIQKGILAISRKEEPFDVFICYKETDDSGKRTQDSVLAQELYYQLKQEGFKVFFARITLEDKLGTEYEPYIFAALNSAKVMVALGTKPEYFNAVWVKNEWSRFLSFIKNGDKKMLIPAHKDMDPYNLPKEFSHLQAQDMSKLGFMQDLIRGIKKILGWDKKTAESAPAERVVVQGEGYVQDTAPLLRRAFLFCEDGEYDSANEYAEKVLDINPECAEAYVIKLLIECRLKKPSDLAGCSLPFTDSHNYQKAIRFATPEYRETIEGYNDAVIKSIDTKRKIETYARGVALMNSHRYDEAVQCFQNIPDYKDAVQRITDCRKQQENERCMGVYERATKLLSDGQFDDAARLFESIGEYKDAKEKVKLCAERKELARKDTIYSLAVNRVATPNADDIALKKSIAELQTIGGYKDTDYQIISMNARLEKWYYDKKKAEEAAKIKAEEDRRTREREAELRRIKAEKTKKKIKKAAKIGIPSVAALAVLVVLTITLIIPLIRFKTADKYINEGKYDDAMRIYRDLGTFSDSEQRIALLNGIKEVDISELEKGVKTILSADVPVKIVYDTRGGDFSDVARMRTILVADNGGIAAFNLSAISDIAPFAANANADGSATTEITYNAASDFSGFPTPVRSGYRFIKWQLGTYDYRVKGAFELKLKAAWSEKEYTILYDLDCGMTSRENPTGYGIEDESFTLTNPIKTGYTFTGWTGTDLNGLTQSVTIHKGSFGDRSYEAHWQANTYTITLDANGGLVDGTTVKADYDQSFTLPDPERKGYIFLGWYDGDNKVTNGTWTRTSDLKLVAKWRVVEYDIIYELDGGMNSLFNPSKYTVGSKVVLASPTRTGYTFLGWTYDGQKKPEIGTTIRVGTVGNKRFTAKWKANDYTVTFDANGGTVSTETLTVTFDARFTLPVPSRKGYTFTGWFNGSTRYGDGTWTRTSDLSLSAEWEPTKYAVSYDLKGGSNHASNPSRYTLLDSFTLKDPSRTGYAFLGWTYAGQTVPSKSVSVPVGTTGELSYTANWKANEYTLSFNANGGTVSPASERVTFDATYTLPTPERIGYTFAGWYKGIMRYSDGYWKNTGDVTLIAKWVPRADIWYVVRHYLQNANDDGYTLKLAQTLTGTADSTVEPSVNSYEHYISPSLKTITINSDGSTVVDYYYNRETYDLTYVTNGGEPIEKQTYKYGQTLAVSVPKREGYTFGGWFADSTLTNAYSATATLNEDTIIYAYWSEENKPADFAYSGTSAIAISAYNGTSTTMWIPTYIGGVQVTKIAASAFKNQTTLTKIVIPDTVTSVGAGAFNGCVAIEDITLPFVGGSANAVNSHGVFGYIFGWKAYDSHDGEWGNYSGNYSFVNTQHGTQPNDAIWQWSCRWSNNYYSGVYSYYYFIPKTIKTVTITVQTDIPTAAFNNCNFIKTINLPKTVEKHGSIGSYAFQNCEALKRLNSTTDGVFKIPETVTAINDYTFYGCKELTTLTLGSNVTSIGSYAFAGCSLLSKFNSEKDNELIVPGKTETIGSDAFEYVLLVKKVVVPDTVTSIGSGAFNGCVAIEDITLPFVGGSIDSTSSLTYAFGTVPATLRNIVITVDTTIPASAFRGLSNVESITIPSDTTIIGESAFKDCVALKRVNSINDGEFNIPKTITEISKYTFFGCMELTTLTLGDGVEIIGDYAFEGCSLLSKFNSENENELIIPKGVATIGEYAFKDVLLVTKVVVADSVISIGVGAFNGCVAIEDITLPFVGASFTAEYSYGVFGYIFDWSTYTVYRNYNTDHESFSDTNRKYNTEYYYTTYVAGKKPANAVWQWSGKDRYYVGGYFTNLYYGHYYYIPTSIKSVTITVQTDIPVAAFNNCNFIETINLPKTVETFGSIGDYAFQNCNATVYYGITPTTSAVWNGSKIAKSYNSGTGTKEDPYVIFDGSQLAYFIKNVNEGETYEGVYFVLGSNINLGGYSVAMIGAVEKNAFAGVLDGNGFTICNLKVSAAGNVNGLSGYLKGTLKNVRIYGYDFSATVKSDDVTYTGALVGYAMKGSVIDGCSVSGKATIVSTGSSNAFGSGFVGHNDGTIRNCVANVVTEMTGDYTIYVGGLVALNSGSVSDSYSSANVVGTSKNFMAYVGGFVGQNTGLVHGSFAYGNVTAKGSSLSYSRNGGFVAVNDGSLEECYRNEEQVLTRYNETFSHCTEGTESDLADIIAYCRINWSSSVWTFDSRLPKLV